MTTKNLSRFVQFGKKIVCAGLNYRKHAAEMGLALPSEPMIFLKPSTSYIMQGDKIKIPKGAKEIHYEVEMGVVIGKKGKSIPESSVLKDYVGGYCLALDMTDRILQNKLRNDGHPIALAKGFDTSCPVGDFIDPSELNDPNNANIWLKVNGDIKQNSNTKDLIFPVSYLVSWISDYFTLEPGDLILTGTPEGVGPVKSGDIIECGLADVSTMTFSVE